MTTLLHEGADTPVTTVEENIDGSLKYNLIYSANLENLVNMSNEF